MMKILGYIWALPCTLVGLVVALVCLPKGLPRWHDGAIELPVRYCIPRFAIAQTWGFLILHREDYRRSIRIHEGVHVRQYLALGPLFLILYPLASLLAVMRGDDAYRGNWFEVQAYNHAEEIENEARL
jgi:hypothetical protein